MGGQDEAVANLQRFCGLLAQTNEGLKEHNSALEAQADLLSDLEDAAEDAWGELADALQDVKDAVADEGGDAQEALDELASTAEGVAGERLSTVKSEMDGAEAAFDEQRQEDSRAMEEAFSELDSSGFQTLSSAVEAAQSGAGASGEEAEAAFAAVEGGLEGLQQDVEAAAGETADALGAAADTLTGEVVAGLESDGAECAGVWTGDLTGAVESGCSSAEGPAAAAYGDFGGEGLAAGDALIESVSTSCTDTGGALADEQGDRLEQAGEVAIGQALPELVAEMGKVQAAIDAGAQTVAALEPMVGELEICKSVVAEVDELLAAIGG